MNNSRFSVALHIMTLLAMDEAAWLTSGHIAGSMNLHSAAVRKEIGVLKKAGLVMAREGKTGGLKIGRPASGIRLWDIYHAVMLDEREQNIKMPNPACFVGKQINTHLNQLYSDLNEVYFGELRKQSLRQFLTKFE